MEKIERVYRRAKWIEKEIIVPDSHTEVYLTDWGKEVLRNLTEEESKLLSIDLTLGGGFDSEEGVIYIVHTEVYPVYRQWRKILKMLRRAEKRLLQQQA